jgi:hypothetical protein
MFLQEDEEKILLYKTLIELRMEEAEKAGREIKLM